MVAGFGWMEDFHLQSVDRARHIEKAPRGAGPSSRTKADTAGGRCPIATLSQASSAVHRRSHRPPCGCTQQPATTTRPRQGMQEEDVLSRFRLQLTATYTGSDGQRCAYHCPRFRGHRSRFACPPQLHRDWISPPCRVRTLAASQSRTACSSYRSTTPDLHHALYRLAL
jgi:hypothetical protein